MLPTVFNSLGRADRSVEVMAPCSTTMTFLCLAEAQALTAFRAAVKGSSATVVASLQAGAAELYEKAARSTRDHAGSCWDFFVCNSLLVQAMAGELHAQLQAGQAERGCLEAQQLLSSCISAADIDSSWRDILQQEVAAVEQGRKPIASDRLIVYCQPLPPEANPLPAAKVLVTAVPYTIERFTNTTAEIAMH
eukprot:gene8639-8820_t